jgi:hypothetical protein
VIRRALYVKGELKGGEERLIKQLKIKERKGRAMVAAEGGGKQMIR